MTVGFEALPRSITSGGSVRFFPRTNSTKPVIGYDWDYGDATAHGTTATPIHAYPTVVTYTTYDVALTLTYADSTTETTTHVKFISSDAIANVTASPTDGTNLAISVFLYDGTNMMMAHRIAWTGCSYYLLEPKITEDIDKIGTATFTLLDVGNSTVTEQSLIKSDTSVIIIMGKSIIFSGTVRRAIQDVTNAFAATTQVKKWDFECDSDLAKLQKTNVDSSILSVGGVPIYDTPGNIVRTILTPTSPARDTRGVINCVDTKITYKLNSNQSESVGNQYDHIMNIAAQNNYDLRSRPDYLVYPYTAFNGATVITNSGAAWTTSEFVGMYAFFVGRTAPAVKTFTTDFASHTDRLLITTASTFFSVNDRVVITTTDTLPTGLVAGTYYVTSVTSTYLTISTTRGGSSATFSDNGTGTHSIGLNQEKDGCATYGKITANTATTITIASLIGASTAPLTLGYFIIYQGYLIDFAQDISQPSVVQNLNANSTCFQYNDNDDKKKLSTKIVAQGKNSSGNTISVSVSGVHAYDINKQFFSDSTFITKLSEGYVYKNNYRVSAASRAVSVKTSAGGTALTYSDPTELYVTDTSQFIINCRVHINAAPSEQFCKDVAAGYLWLCATRGGVYSEFNTYWSYSVSSNGYFVIDNADGYLQNGTMFRVTADVFPSGVTAGTIYYVVGTILNTSTEPVYFSTAVGGTPISIGSAGTNVAIVKILNEGSGGIPDPNPTIWMYGWGLVIPSGTTLAVSTEGAGATAITTIDTPSEGTDSNGVAFTQLHISAWLTSDYSGKGMIMAGKLYVDKASYVGNTAVLIGEEPLTIVSNGLDTTYGYYIDVGDPTLRVSSASRKCYPHGIGALVARTNYTEASPETGSPIALYGLHIDTRTVDSSITYSTLDTYATSLLLGLGNFWIKATTWSPVDFAYVLQVGEYYEGQQSSLARPIKVGDNITITQFSGSTPSDPYEVVETSIIGNEGRIMLTLGDFEKNAYTSLLTSTNSVNRTLT